MKRTLVLKLAALGLALGALQLVYGAATAYKDAPSTVLRSQQYAEEGRSILYLGDSTVYRGDASDDDGAGIADMLGRELPSHSIGGIFHDAYHMGLFRYFVDYASEIGHQPEYVIAAVNMRALSPERHGRPEYQFAKEKLFLSHPQKTFWSFFRPFAAFKTFDLAPVSQREFEATPIYDAETYVGAMGEIEERYRRDRSEANLRDLIRATYMYPLDERHPQLQGIMDIVRTCEKNGSLPIFYITPINYELAERHLGERFAERLKINATLINSLLAGTRAVLLDLSLELPSSFFAAGEFPDAYLKDEGRKFVAEKLAEAVRKGTGR